MGIARFQLFTFFATTFAALTDLAGAARGNLITLAISITNDIINLERASILNQIEGAPLQIDLIGGSASLSFVCPNYPGSFIDGMNFSSTADDMKVAVIGCVGSSTISKLLTLRHPTDLGASIRLVNKIIQIVLALAKGQGTGTTATADSVDIGGGLLEDDHAVFIEAGTR